MKLKKKIEKKRLEMYEAYKKNPSDSQVLIISQELDVLLNKYSNALKNQ